MTPAWALRATVDDILGNPGAAFRISMPMVLSIVLLFLVVIATIATFGDSNTEATISAAILLPIVFTSVMVIVGSTWTAVAWHRHVILGEKPGALLPQWPRGRLLGYFGRSIIVYFVVFAVAIVPLLLALAFAPTSISEDGMRSFDLGGMPTEFSATSITIWALLSALIWGVSLRAGLILPARAIDRSKTLGEVWAATKGRFLVLFAPLGLIIALVFAVLDFTTSVVSFGGVTELISLWLQVMIGIGILTRLYVGIFGLALPAPLGQGDGTEAN